MNNSDTACWMFESLSEADTARLGRALAAVLPKQAVVALDGPLGAGKTRLVQAIAEAAGIDRSEVVSPTFVLIQEHHGAQSIYHMDAYRLAGAEEFRQMGGEEYFQGGSPAWTFVEWAERIGEALPPDTIFIAIEPRTGDARSITITAPSDEVPEFLAALRELEAGH